MVATRTTMCKSNLDNTESYKFSRENFGRAFMEYVGGRGNVEIDTLNNYIQLVKYQTLTKTDIAAERNRLYYEFIETPRSIYNEKWRRESGEKYSIDMVNEKSKQFDIYTNDNMLVLSHLKKAKLDKKI
jgi:hypothetical protein